MFLLVIYILVMWIFDLKHRWNLKYLGDYDIVRGILRSPFPLIV